MVGDIRRWRCTMPYHILTIIFADENQGERGGKMTLPLSAIAMLIFGSVVLYGGLAYFVYRALKSMKK